MVNYRADGFSNNWVSKGVNERKDVPQAVEDDRSQEVVPAPGHPMPTASTVSKRTGQDSGLCN